MMGTTCIDICKHAGISKNQGMRDALLLSDSIQPGHFFWEALTNAGFHLHSGIDEPVPTLGKDNSLVFIDASADSMPYKWFHYLMENENDLEGIRRVLLVAKDEKFLDEKTNLFRCETIIEIQPCDKESIQDTVNLLVAGIGNQQDKPHDRPKWYDFTHRLLDEIYHHNNRVEIFHKIVELAPSIREYDFTLNSILKQLNKVFSVPVSSLYVRQDGVIYTLVSEPVSKDFLKNHLSELRRLINEKENLKEEVFEITWGRNLVIGDFSQVCTYPSSLIFPLESKGDNLGYCAFPSSEEKYVLDDVFISLITQQITLLIRYSWLYKKQGLTVRNNLHRLGAINEVCKLFADIDGKDFGLQFLLILLEHISADKGFLILLDDNASVTDYHCVGFDMERMAANLNCRDKLPYMEVFEGNVLKTGIMNCESLDENGDSASYHYFGLPLAGVRGNIGVVFIFFKTPPTGEEDFMAFFQSMAILAGTHFESIELYHQYLEKRIIEEQINIARQIQRELLPKGTPELEHFWIAAESRPATQVGGDFYDFVTLPSSRQAVLIGDVSGKGIPASQLMSMTKSLLKFHLEHTGNLCETMFDVNNYLARETPSEKFVTVQSVLIDEHHKKIEMVNGGHEFLLVYRAETGEFEEIRSEGLPLGISSNVNFTKINVDYKPGDIFVMFTDGLPEAMSPDKEMFGIQRVKQILKDVCQWDVKEILNWFYLELDGHASGSPRHDDTTIIILKAK